MKAYACLGRDEGERELLDAREIAAVDRLIRRIRQEVAAELVQASLFGSKARGQARPDSDVDVLLVFRRLPPDREPQASHAERIAEEVAAVTGVPVTVWSVSLVDLERGQRTPMLVDALSDAVPLWFERRPLPVLAFTPEDAARCVGALLDRVAEGEAEVAARVEAGEYDQAAARVRDDLVRMCVALHLLTGETRPRRGEAARNVLNAESGRLPAFAREALAWAETSYGPDGRDDEAPVPPPADPTGAMRAVGFLRGLVLERLRGLEARVGTSHGSAVYR